MKATLADLREFEGRQRFQHTYRLRRAGTFTGYLIFERRDALLRVTLCDQSRAPRSKHQTIFERHVSGETGVPQLEVRGANGRYRPFHEVLMESSG